MYVLELSEDLVEGTPESEPQTAQLAGAMLDP
jgi:hypothetical protein